MVAWDWGIIWGKVGKDHEKTLGSDDCSLSDGSNGFTGIHLCQNLEKCTF